MALRNDLVTVDLETVTPLFLSAIPGGQPELRPPSVRGALRFWWRAWRQATAPCADADSLFAAESAVFGSTEGASPLVVRLAGKLQTPLQMRRAPYPTGLDYMFYGLYDQQSGAYHPAWRPGRHVTLTLSRRPQPGPSQPLGRDALAALWLLCNLGGLGARTRRGAGALHGVLKAGAWPADLPPLDLGAAKPMAFAVRLGKALRQLLSPAAVAPVNLPVPSLHPQQARVFVLDKAWETAQEALDEFGDILRLYRQRYDLSKPGSDYFAVKEFVRKGGPTPHTVDRAAFGLPLPFYFSSLRDRPARERRAVVTALDPNGEAIDRSASRMHVRVVRLDNEVKPFGILLVFFGCPLLEAGARLDLDTPLAAHRPADIPADSLLVGFRNKLRGTMGLLEVKYG